MELSEKNTKARSAYEVALERAERKSHKLDQPAPKGVEPRQTDEDGFAVTDHVSIQTPSFSKIMGIPGIVTDALHEVGFDLDDITEMPSLPDAEPRSFEACVHWEGPMFDYGGYARMNRTYIINLHSMGAMVRVIPKETITNVNKKTEEFLRMLSHTKLSNKYPRVYGMTIPDIMGHGGPKILYTMMETSIRIHPELVDRYNMADELWVPCTWNETVFRDSGVLTPIKVLPLGVDTTAFSPEGEKIPLSGGSFKFLSVFGWSYRKGFDVMIQAFLEEFSRKEDVSLVLSTRFEGQAGKTKRIMDDFKYIRGLVKKSDADLPHVALHNGYTPDADMPKLYRSCQCFVLPSRGEGQGLPYMEAGSCGLPVIASDHGGQRDFLDSDVAYMVEPDGYFTSRRTDPPFQNMAWISHFYEDQQFPKYERPAIDKLRAHMRDVYENYSAAKSKGEALRNRLVENFDWTKCSERVYQRLVETCRGINP
jgi:glycosyltransferase involved in cell wall biosynthesis